MPISSLAPMLMALALTTAGCSKSTFGGLSGKTSTSDDDDEGETATPPQEVTGAFLVECEHAVDTPEAEGSANEAIGCAVRRGVETAKYQGSVDHLSMTLTFADADVETPTLVVAPAEDRHHVHFELPKGRWDQVVSGKASLVVDSNAITASDVQVDKTPAATLAFVERAFQDVLGRLPATAETSQAQAVIKENLADQETRRAWARTLFDDPSVIRATVGEWMDMFWNARDESRLAAYVSALQGGRAYFEVMAEIMADAKTEATIAVKAGPVSTDEEFIDQLYKTLALRPRQSVEEGKYWDDLIAQGAARTLLSSEFLRAQGIVCNDIALSYKKYLRDGRSVEAIVAAVAGPLYSADLERRGPGVKALVLSLPAYLQRAD